jgi:maltose O-acetyltransferase
MVGAILSYLREWKQRRHMASLLKRGLQVGENTSILDGVFLDPSHCFLISIGKNCTLAPGVRVLAHDASTNRSLGITKIGSVIIKDNSFLGDSTLVLPGVTIGPHAIVGAGAVVTKDIPPNSVAAGNPARVLCSLDEFLTKHRAAESEGRVFSTQQYGIESITEARKQELIDWVRTRPAYLRGRSTGDGV